MHFDCHKKMVLFKLNTTGGLSRVNKNLYASHSEAVASVSEPGTYIVLPADELIAAIAEQDKEGIDGKDNLLVPEYVRAVLADALTIDQVPPEIRATVAIELVKRAEGLRFTDERIKLPAKKATGQASLKAPERDLSATTSSHEHVTENNETGEADTES
jgi:hypothetical protein